MAITDLSLKGAEVLLLEDDALLRKRLAAYLGKQGAEVTTAAVIAEARRLLTAGRYDFALLDINLPDGEGLDLLRERLLPPTTGVVVMTAEGGVARAVEAIKLGAGDYLAKPFDPEELRLVFTRLRQNRQRDRLVEHARRGEEREGLFFGESLAAVGQQLERILQAEQRLAANPPPILIVGETGTGKTALSRWLHRQGPRSSGALVEVNCPGLPETLAESELFGHEKGAFTDAKGARLGLFEAADGGTLFLDEIASLSLSVQAKVLTALEDRQIRRVGGNKPVAVDVRLIAASNRDLRAMVAEGEFRSDLLHRLDLLRVDLPPLRERSGDLEKLATHLLESICRRYRLPSPGLAPEGIARLGRYPWPGNVRELAHELERAVILGDGRPLAFAHLAAPGEKPTPGSGSGQTSPTGDWLAADWQLPESGFKLENALNRFIRLALDQTNGNVSAAARRLGVTRDYLRYRLAEGQDREAGQPME